MGEYMNVNHAKAILTLLFFQAGTNIIEEEDGRMEVTLKEGGGQLGRPADSVLKFYTQFTDPGSQAYTWGRSLPFDRNAFTAGKVAFYIGTAVEIADIEAENPNMNFDITPVPQAEGVTALRNVGTFYGFAIPKASRNAPGAYRVAYKLAGAETGVALAEALRLVPVVRSAYTGPTGDAYKDVAREAALIARGFLDPSPQESAEVFRGMITGIISGEQDVEEVVNDAAYELGALLR
jgi:ABC-type glycerol-3-phosphate transport system substrate-binding protein